MTALQKLRPTTDTSCASVAHQHDSASYIAALAFELRQIAIAANLSEVVSPLEQVYYQAWAAAERRAEPGSDQPHPQLDEQF
jgi:hypothetical protein